MKQTKIEWTETTWNPVTGCSKISAGCKNCYAEKMARRLQGMGQANYINGFDLTIHPDQIEKPLKWKKPRKIFVCSMSDLFHFMIDPGFIDRTFATIEQTPQHVYQVLTKRPEIALDYFTPPRRPPANVWLGVTAENQATYNHRYSFLYRIPAKIRFLSCEPLLEKIDLKLGFMNWVIVGAESGPGRRPCPIENIEHIVKQCQAANCPVFVKQISINGKIEKDLNKFPESVRFRQFPADEIQAPAGKKINI